MSESLLIIVGAAVLAGVGWIVWRAALPRSDAGGDGGGILHDGSCNSASGSNCGDFHGGGDGGCDGGGGD